MLHLLRCFLILVDQPISDEKGKRMCIESVISRFVTAKLREFFRLINSNEEAVSEYSYQRMG